MKTFITTAALVAALTLPAFGGAMAEGSASSIKAEGGAKAEGQESSGAAHLHLAPPAAARMAATGSKAEANSVTAKVRTMTERATSAWFGC